MCASVCLNNELVPFSGFLLSHYEYTTYILAHLPDFLSCGTIFLLSHAQATWHHVECLIRALNENCRSLLKSRGTWLTLVRH